MTKDQLIAITRKKCVKFGSQAAFAREIGIKRDFLNQFINGKKNPPARLLAYLGYKPKTIYEKI